MFPSFCVWDPESYYVMPCHAMPCHAMLCRFLSSTLLSCPLLSSTLLSRLYLSIYVSIHPSCCCQGLMYIKCYPCYNTLTAIRSLYPCLLSSYHLIISSIPYIQANTVFLLGHVRPLNSFAVPCIREERDC